MQEVRCKKCGKKLGMVEGSYEIKCPRCKPEYIEKGNTERSVEDVYSIKS